MSESEKRPTGLSHSGEKLRKLLLEHPDLPLLVFANEDANSGDYSLMSCYSVFAEIGEFLDCRQEIEDEIVFTDRHDFEEAVSDSLYDCGIEDEDELEREFKKRVEEYAPYWKPCIILTVGN